MYSHNWSSQSIHENHVSKHKLDWWYHTTCYYYWCTYLSKREVIWNRYSWKVDSTVLSDSCRRCKEVSQRWLQVLWVSRWWLLQGLTLMWVMQASMDRSSTLIELAKVHSWDEELDEIQLFSLYLSKESNIWGALSKMWSNDSEERGVWAHGLCQMQIRVLLVLPRTLFPLPTPEQDPSLSLPLCGSGRSHVCSLLRLLCQTRLRLWACGQDGFPLVLLCLDRFSHWCIDLCHSCNCHGVLRQKNEREVCSLWICKDTSVRVHRKFETCLEESVCLPIFNGTLTCPASHWCDLSDDTLLAIVSLYLGNGQDANSSGSNSSCGLPLLRCISWLKVSLWTLQILSLVSAVACKVETTNTCCSWCWWWWWNIIKKKSRMN